MNPKSIRIVFMGTPGFAVGILRRLLDEKYNVVAVVTTPDKPAGRGKKVHQSEVKQFAFEHHLPVLQPEKLKSPEFLSELKSYNPDLQIVVAFRMLPEVVWQLPPLGTFNLHASLLPQYRGAAPINRAIMQGETVTGVTTFFLQHEIDTGNILFREQVAINPNETAGELHDALMAVGAELVTKTVDAIASGNLNPVPQSQLVEPGETLHEAPKIFREDCKISWEQPGQKIHDFIRGLSPYPGAWTMASIGDSAPFELKIFKTKFFPGESSNGKFPEVNTGDGKLLIEEIQAPGKKRMPPGDFLRGLHGNELVLLP